MARDEKDVDAIPEAYTIGKKLMNIFITNTVWKVSVFGVILVRNFPHSYSVSLRIKSECGKIRTRITPNTYAFYAVVRTVTRKGFKECEYILKYKIKEYSNDGFEIFCDISDKKISDKE